MAADGGTPRPTTKVDPQELLGLVALTAGKERLRPTCKMPKIELAHLLRDPGQPPRAATVDLAKGSSGIAPIPKQVLAAAAEADAAAAAPAPARRAAARPTLLHVASRIAQRTRRYANARSVLVLAACTAAATAASYFGL